MKAWRNLPNLPPDSTQTASGKPGAVHADFPVAPSGAVRLSPDLARVAASRALATKADTARVATWMAGHIMRA